MVYDYNSIAEIYDEVRESDVKMIKAMLALAQINSESDKDIKILEIGCGTGNNLKVIEQHAVNENRIELWGIDSSVGMLEKAKEKCNAVTLLKDDATKLELLSDHTFDLVFMVDVIHHIKDISSMFYHIHRVLKSNGSVVVFTDSHEHIQNRLTTKYFPETLTAELGRYQDTKEIAACLQTQGFANISTDTIDLDVQSNYGNRLIEIALMKGYSMFGLISEEAITSGIQQIKKDMELGDIIYRHRAPYIYAKKYD